MVADLSRHPYQQLVAHWSEQFGRLARGVDDRDIGRFERLHRVRFPEEFRQYFLHVNGMAHAGGRGADREGFSFWPLADLKPLSAIERASQQRWFPSSYDEESAYVFADYWDWSRAYAIFLAENHPSYGQVVHVGTLESRSFDDFSTFVDCYVQNCRSLYQGWTR